MRATPLYFGCWSRAGHGFHLPSGLSPAPYKQVVAALPFGPVDGKLNPSAKQGEAALRHAGGWTAVAWADYTVDSRRGSNSVVFLPGTLTFAEALAAAADAFPHVMARQPVKPWDAAPLGEAGS